MDRRIAIVGAGPAGLTAAYELQKLGLSSTILEADEQVGGLSRTVKYEGYRFDVGGHRFFSKSSLVNSLWQEILGEDLLLRSRLSRIHYRGHFFDYPLRPLNALLGLGATESLKVMVSYAKAKLFPDRDEKNFEQWVSNRFGKRLYRIFFKTYTEKVWGMQCSDISADWAAQRIKNLSLGEAIRAAFFRSQRNKDGQIITTLIDSFMYPRLGPGMMWERCAEKLDRLGSKTIRGTSVEKVRISESRVVSLIGRNHYGDKMELDADDFISSMPLASLVNSIDPLPPSEVIRAARALQYRDYLTVVLIVQRKEVFPDNWIYIHSPQVRMGRVQNYKNWSPEMVPNSDRTALGLEYFLWNSDDMWSWPDERLIDFGKAECAELGLIFSNEVIDGAVVRMRRAYPVYDSSYRKNVTLIKQYLATLANFQTIGRNGLHRYNNQDHSMLTGVYAARNTMGEQNDVWAVNTEATYHEQGTSPDGASTDREVPRGV